MHPGDGDCLPGLPACQPTFLAIRRPLNTSISPTLERWK